MKVPTKPIYYLWLLGILAAFVIFFRLGAGSLGDWDEAIYAAVAKTIFKTGDYLSLYLNGRYWPEKPPLIIWAMNGCLHLFGVEAWASRLPTAVLGWLAVMITAWTGRILFDRWTGIIAGLFLTTNLHFIVLSRMGMLDVPLMFFISLSLLLFWMAQKDGRLFVWAGVCMGLAVMTKSLVGFFPVVIAGGYILLMHQPDKKVKKGFWIMTAAAVGLALPWHLVQWIRHGSRFTDYYFHYNLLQRAFKPIEGHAGSWMYYLRYLSEHFFTPWLYFAMAVFAAGAVMLFRQGKKGLSNQTLFLLVWFGSVVVFFTLARTKIIGYIVPAYVPLALLTAKLGKDLSAKPVWKYAFAGMIAASVGMGLLVHPMGWAMIDKSPDVRQLAMIATNPDGILYVMDVPPNAPSFYFSQRIKRLDDPDRLVVPQSGQPVVYLLCKRERTASLAIKWSVTVLGQGAGQGLVLLKIGRIMDID